MAEAPFPDCLRGRPVQSYVMRLPVVFLIALLLPAGVLAEPVRLTTDSDGQLIGPLSEYLEDPGGSLSLNDVQIENVVFRPTAMQRPGFGYTPSAYWFRFDVQNDRRTSTVALIELVSLIDSIRVFVLKENRVVQEFEAGRWLPMEKRAWPHRNFLFPIRLESQEQVTVYMRFQSQGSLLLPLTLWSQEAFARKDHVEQFVFGIYFGIIFVMAAYNLFLFWSVRDLSYLYYVLYIAGFGLIFAGVWGFGHELLWNWNMWWANYSLPFFIAFSCFWMLLFTMRFLNTRQIMGYVDYGFRALAVVAGLTMLFVLFSGMYGAGVRAALYLALATTALVLASSIIALVRGYRPARYFLLAFVALLVATVVVVFRNLALLPYNWFTNYSTLAGSAAEVVLLSLALGDRINTLRRERDLLQQQALEQERRLADSFARFVPREFLNLLGKQDITQIELGDQIQRSMTVLFSDIRSFTTLSESMSPAENFNFLNAYLKRMGPCIRSNGGFIDKYIGDAIMALFPGPADDALRAAIAMEASLAEYNQHRQNSNYAPVEIGIGIHTGTLMLGTIGTELRMQGTVISDAVNLGSRLEGLTQPYGARILVSEETYGRLSPELQSGMRYLGRVTVKGKRKAVDIYECFISRAEPARRLRQSTLAQFETAVAHLLAGRVETARQGFEAVLALDPEDRAARHYLERILSPPIDTGRTSPNLL